MASSSKVMFNLKTLRDKAVESIDFRIAQQRLEVESYDDDEALEERIRLWREEQVGKFMNMYVRLTGPESEVPDNHTISKFKVDPIPEVDRWDRSRANQKLHELESTRSRILAKSESLVPDEDGNISLTKLQLREFFGL